MKTSFKKGGSGFISQKEYFGLGQCPVSDLRMSKQQRSSNMSSHRYGGDIKSPNQDNKQDGICIEHFFTLSGDGVKNGPACESVIRGF